MKANKIWDCKYPLMFDVLQYVIKRPPASIPPPTTCMLSLFCALSVPLSFFYLISSPSCSQVVHEFYNKATSLQGILKWDMQSVRKILTLGNPYLFILGMALPILKWTWIIYKVLWQKYM